MTLALAAGLLGLALVDSTSIGTLVIPLWLLLVPGRPSTGRYVTYLGVIGGFYAVVGLLVFAAIRAGVSVAPGLLENPVVLGVQLAVGVALFAWSFRLDSSKNRTRGTPDRVEKIRARVLRSDGGVATTTGLALVAGLSEVVTMLPYIGAIGLLVAADVSTPVAVGVLVAYCLVMVVPALILLVVRVVLGGRVDGPLLRLDEFVARRADSALGWVIGVVGFLLAASAANTLFG
ncbi:MAG: GAP family protein [Rhodococcus sp. (in: high G+C Gram-positive bacteria)]